MNVIESATGSVRQDGILLTFIFRIEVGTKAEFRRLRRRYIHRSWPQESRVIG
jgi:hypothetical protein